ncbi:MAG TPA: hypothetical protein VIC28_15780, partial [Thermoanaerobaculia bacterium]
MRPHIFLAAIVATLAVLASWNRPLVADAPQAVTVTNFPETQQVSGRVVVSAPIPQTRFETKKALVS